ncbi:MAG: DUF2156 domain-containing protein [Bacillota bacterium]
MILITAVNSIKAGLSFRELRWDDQAVFGEILRKLQPETSDQTFTSLFIWQYSYGLRIAQDLDLQAVVPLARPQTWTPFYLPPLFQWSAREKFAELLQKMLFYAEKNGFPFQIRRAPEMLAREVELTFPGVFEIVRDRKADDYVYRTEDLIKLAGRKYHAKRNFLNRFKKNYRWAFRDLTPDLVPGCIAVFKKWCEQKDCEKITSLFQEHKAILTLLENFSSFPVSGGVIQVDGNIEAFTIGEELNRETAVIHAEKANTEIDGIYAAINQMYAESRLNSYKYINREEDLGLENLRKAKQSYFPCRMVEKYIIKKR